MRRSQVLHQDRNGFFSVEQGCTPPYWMYSLPIQTLILHPLETVHSTFHRHCKDSPYEWFVILGLLPMVTLFPLSPAKSFIGFFFCICNFVQTSMNKQSANELILLLWWAENGARNSTVCLLREKLRGMCGTLHCYYSLLYIFKQAQIIFVKRKKKFNFIYYGNKLFYTWFCFCLSLCNSKSLNWVFDLKCQNREITSSGAWEALVGTALMIVVFRELNISEISRWCNSVWWDNRRECSYGTAVSAIEG